MYLMKTKDEALDTLKDYCRHVGLPKQVLTDKDMLIHMSIHVSMHMSIHMPIHMSKHVSIHLSIHVSTPPGHKTSGFVITGAQYRAPTSREGTAMKLGPGLKGA